MPLLFSACSTARKEVYPVIPYGKTYAVASWYGKKFHGRPTSSGEIYNMYGYTCAHKEYPFGTRLKVTYPESNKSVECVVNDRGPFIKGRDLDLSYAAAKKIGLIGPGTDRVLLEILGRDSSYVKKVNISAIRREGPFAIQFGAFTNGINAIRLKKALNLKFKNVYIQEANITGIKYYRVRVGNFDNLDDAIILAEELSEEGYQVIVIKAEVKI